MIPLFGLVLAGGRSRRMQTDKAALRYGRRPQLEVAFDLVSAVTDDAFISVRADQAQDPFRARFPQVIDGPVGAGPIAGIVAAQARHPEAAWLVLACDLPYLDSATLDQLLAGRDSTRIATAFRSAGDRLPEPLCAIYEPASREPILGYIAGGGACPRKFLLTREPCLLDAANARALGNANTPQELAAARTEIASGGTA